MLKEFRTRADSVESLTSKAGSLARGRSRDSQQEPNEQLRASNKYQDILRASQNRGASRPSSK